MNNDLSKNISEKIANKKLKHWILIFYMIISSIIGGIITLLIYNISHIEKPPRFELIVSDSTKLNSIKIQIDSIYNFKLENMITSVDKKNDGRFEVLTWASILLITLLIAFLTINFIVSSSHVKEIVDEKIKEKYNEIIYSIMELSKSVEEKKLQIEKDFETIDLTYKTIIEYDKLKKEDD